MDHCPFTFINTACSWLDMSSSTFSWLFYATCCRVCYFYFTFYEMTIFNFYLPRWNLAFFFSYKLRYVSFLFFRGFVVVTTYTIMEALETIKRMKAFCIEVWIIICFSFRAVWTSNCLFQVLSNILKIMVIFSVMIVPSI